MGPGSASGSSLLEFLSARDTRGRMPPVPAPFASGLRLFHAFADEGSPIAGESHLMHLAIELQGYLTFQVSSEIVEITFIAIIGNTKI